MKIYLYEQEIPFLKKLLPTAINNDYTGWLANSILDKIAAEEEQNEIETTCTHKKGSYTGRKQCCVKCGNFFEPGMGFDWTRDKRYKTYKKLTAIEEMKKLDPQQELL